MTKKDEIQECLKNQIVASCFRGIVLSSVRSGKTRILISAIKEHSVVEKPKVLVLYPNIDIKNSWIDECAKVGCPFDITFCTFISIEKVMDGDWNYVVFDEAHLIPEEHKLPIAGQMAKKYKHVVFASGTYNKNTLADLKIHTELPLIVEYTTEQAIADGLISDYSVYIHQYDLNPITLRRFGTAPRAWWSTDVKELARLSKKVGNSYGDKKMIASLNRMRFINTNESLLSFVVTWIIDNPGKRFIIFTDNENFGKKFKLPMYNSKSKDDKVLQAFIKGEINQLCLIRKGSAGVTYPNLDNILITSINSNGENLEQMLGRALLLDTVHSDIHIFTTDKAFQLNWLESALSNIDKSRITWVKQGKIVANPR